MADQPTLFNDLACLLDVIPQARLVAMTQRATLHGIENVCQHQLRGRNLASVVATLFPDFFPSRVAEVARRIALNAIKNGCLRALSEASGSWALTIRSPDQEAAERLRAHQGPAILVFWHFGPVNLLILGLRRIGVKALFITRAHPSAWLSPEERREQRIAVKENDPRQNVTILRQSLKHLKNGGKVAIAIDGSLGQRDMFVPFLGRRFAVSRGAAGLARLTGVPIIPCTMQWDGSDWRMAIRVFDPLPTPSVSREDAEAFEKAVLVSAARHFESYGLHHPGQFKIDQLAELIDSPPLELGA